MASDIAGSWFPTGFYGHFRSRSRNDFVCEYRQLAKPQPPEKFLKRFQQPTPKHVFSAHDNRHAYLSDALYFEQGLGRRRKPGTNPYNADFYTWMPLKKEIESNRPLASTYRIDFSKNGGKQLLVRRPQTAFDLAPTTTYRYTHGSDAPYYEEINSMSRIPPNRAKSARPAACRETVASCLSWYRPPVATLITQFQSTPPTSAAPAQSPVVHFQPTPPTSAAPSHSSVHATQAPVVHFQPALPQTSVLDPQTAPV